MSGHLLVLYPDQNGSHVPIKGSFLYLHTFKGLLATFPFSSWTNEVPGESTMAGSITQAPTQRLLPTMAPSLL